MKEKVDSEKIIRHIKYTRHWLDKANDDFTDKRFSAGGMILNLARAEITAALEEALMLKSRVAAKLPAARPSLKWGVASSVSLLASGFIIAVFIIQFTSNPIARPKSMKTVPTVTVRELAPAPSVEPAPVVSEPVATPAPAKPAAHRRAVRKPAVSTPVTPEIEPIVGQASSLSPPVEQPVVAPVEQPKTTIGQTDIIDLYRTAKDALAK